jgi:acyl-CoA synthetase (AMP-forming)/AMP-acid ligase II
VALIAPDNDCASVIAILGAWGAGLAVALIDPTLNSVARDHIVDALHPEVVFTPEDGFDITGRCGEPITSGTGILLSTSGTTGSSKFARLSTGGLLANASQIVQALNITEDEVGICHLPLHYSYGLSVLLSHIEQGAGLFLTKEKITSPEFPKKIAAAGGSHLPGVPFHYTTMLRLGCDRVVPTTVRTFTQAGGHLDRSSREAFYTWATHRKARFYIMYGQTEAGPRMTTLASEAFSGKPESVGKPMAGGRIEIVNESGVRVPAGQVGQIVYHGPNVMWGYATSRACLGLGDEMNGCLETGDMGWLDSDGDLFVTGRNQRFAKVAGLRISLDEVERYLKADFDVALISEADSIRVFVAGQQNCREALSSRLSELAAVYKIPRRSFLLVPVPAIPLRESGKVDFARLRELV